MGIKSKYDLNSSLMPFTSFNRIYSPIYILIDFMIKTPLELECDKILVNSPLITLHLNNHIVGKPLFYLKSKVVVSITYFRKIRLVTQF